MDICMVVYTNYSIDARVRREADTLASLPGYSVVVITPKEGRSPETHTVRGVKVQEVNLNKYRGKNRVRYLQSYLKFMFLAFLGCSKLLVGRSLDVVHIHNMPDCLIFSAILPLLLGKKIILDIHDTIVETYSSKFNDKTHKFTRRMLHRLLCLEESICCSLAHQIICVNHVQREVLIKRGIPEKKITISMNVPDPRSFTHGKENGKGDAEEGFRLVYFGTIARRLGIDLAIRAVAKLKGQIPGLRFVILGDGEDRQDCIRLSEDLGTNNVVYFSETYVPHDELMALLPGLDLVVVANRKNPATELMLPVKMLEGIALGMPVIVPRLRAIEYYFSDDQVYYFEADSVDSLTDTILNAYHNRSRSLIKVRRANQFIEKHGWGTHKLDLINLYREL
jgi:glycosyltransferase involved in cell wall biosynthesis